MKNKERLIAAIRGETPDIVPVAPLIHNRFAYTIQGNIGWKAVFDVHNLIGSIWFRGPLGIALSVKNKGRWKREYNLIEQKKSKKVYEEVIKTSSGKITSKTAYGMVPSDPTLIRIIESFVKSDKDYEIYIEYLKEFVKYVQADFKEVTKAYHVMGDDGVPSVGTSCSFSHLCGIRGPEDLLVDLYRRPELVKETLDLLQELKKKEVEAFIESPSVVLYYDVWGSYDMSPNHFKKWIIPDLQKTVNMVRKADKLVGFYMVGKIKDQLPLAIETKPHFIEPFELQSNISLTKAKNCYGKEVCIMGNFDPLILAFGSVSEAKKETIRCLNEGMKGGGYVLVTGDEVPPNAKIENLRAMVKTVEKLGRY
jgi:uroporphyrinogen-III decarboxylase